MLSIQVFSSISGLILAALFLIVFEISEFKKNTQNELSTMAGLIGNRSTAALLFDDRKLAKENLATLEQMPIFQSACIYNVKGQVFASVKLAELSEQEPCSGQFNTQTTFFEGAKLHVYQAFFQDEEILGTVYIQADLKVKFLHKMQSIALLITVLFAATVVTFLLTTPLIRLIITPLKKLLKTVNKITEEKDYSQRAIKQNDDEIGKLVDSFNNMIVTVESQNRALTVAKDHYLALYDDNPTMVFNLSADGLILSVNRFGARQLELNSEELLHCYIYDFIHLDDLLTIRSLFNSCMAVPQKVHKHELRMVCSDARVIWARVTARLIENENENQQDNFLLVCEDVTETRLLSEKIAYQASHDALTGLVNRSQFDTYIQTAVFEATNENLEHALCYMDLDQFKLVNDTSGHMAGDELLRQLEIF